MDRYFASTDPPTFSHFLKLLSSEQRRIIVTLVVKNAQFNALGKILAQESVEAQEYFKIWWEHQENGQSTEYSEMNTKNKSSPANCNSDSEDDDDSNKDPTKWVPKIKDDFFVNLPETMNILILGETGVGKSTFINGLANYLRFENMYQAIDRFEILIKASFSHCDKDYNQQKIVCNSTNSREHNTEENENLEVGQSSTQSPKSYLITYGPPARTKKIRIIDTPGIGDSRGIEHDKHNFTKILDYISHYKELHAICILMKPNENRLSLNFCYCLNELFTRFHVSANKNILFCFTNTRQTLYQPGEIIATLSTYLEKLKELGEAKVKIPLDSSTMFCFDNESFRFLCALREGAQFSKNETANFSSSWKITVKETFRMLKRIAGLSPHTVAETLTLNNARTVALGIAKHTADFSRTQFLNIQYINKKTMEIEDCIKMGTDFKKKLYIKQIEVVPEKLSEPITVCTTEKCVEYKKMGNHPGAKVEVDYTTICHDPCNLKGVQTEQLPNPALKHCYVFETEGNICIKCGCSWEYHMHLRYKLNKVVKKIIDPVVEEFMKKCTNEEEAAELFLQSAKRRKRDLEELLNSTMNKTAEITAYMKDNSLLPHNDAYREYIDYSIAEAERAVERGGCVDYLELLKSYKNDYHIEVKMFEDLGSHTCAKKNAEQLNSMLMDLKNSKDCGPVLREVQKLELLKVEKEEANTDVIVKTKGWFNTQFNSMMTFAKGCKDAVLSLW